MEVDLNKRYRTRSGLEVELIHKDDRMVYPIVGKIADEEGRLGIETWTSNGAYYTKGESDADLIEVLPYDHIKEGDLVMVWDDCHLQAKLGVFKRVGSLGLPITKNKNTDSSCSWRNCLTVEEYAEKYLK